MEISYECERTYMLLISGRFPGPGQFDGKVLKSILWLHIKTYAFYFIFICFFFSPQCHNVSGSAIQIRYIKRKIRCAPAVHTICGLLLSDSMLVFSFFLLFLFTLLLCALYLSLCFETVFSILLAVHQMHIINLCVLYMWLKIFI